MRYKENEMVCIKKEDILKAKSALRANGFTLGQLHKAYKTSEERVKFLTEQFGDQAEAEYFNNKYERYLLNRQQDRLRDWVRSAKQKGIDTNTTKSLMDKIDSMQKILGNDKESKTFLNGLVKAKLGFMITREEANKIKSMNDNVIAEKKNVLKLMPNYLTMSSQEFHEALADPEKSKAIYNLAIQLAGMKQLYDQAKVAADQAERGEKALIKWNWQGKTVSLGEFVTQVAGHVKSLKATYDISWGRQLSGMFLSGTKEVAQAGWKGWKEGLKTWTEFAKESDPANREAKALLIEGLLMARPNSLNGNYARLGVAVGMQEEAFPETLMGKVNVPVLSNIFVASEKGFNIAIQTARAEMTDTLIDMYDGDMGALKAEDAGGFVNEITGRGKLPFNNPNAERVVNALFFAPRWFASRVAQIYNLPKYGLKALKGEAGKIDKMRLRASMAQLTLMAVLIPAIKGILRALDDDDIHGDDWWERFWSAYEMRSSDFGKIVVGDTRFDLSSGLNGILTTAARVVTGETVSIAGVKRKKNWADVIGAFAEGKMSPAARLTMDIWRKVTEGEKAKNFMYQPITWKGLAVEAVSPISIENMFELSNPTDNKTAQVIGILADIVGIGANTYGIDEKSVGKSVDFRKAEFELAWKENRNPQPLTPSASSNIMKKLTGKTQEKAIAEYSKLYNDRATALVTSREYQAMESAEQAKALTKVRDGVTNEINKKYGLKK